MQHIVVKIFKYSVKHLNLPGKCIILAVKNACRYTTSEKCRCMDQ